MHLGRPGTEFQAHAKARARSEGKKWLGVRERGEPGSHLSGIIFANSESEKSPEQLVNGEWSSREAWVRQYTLAHETVTALFRKGVCTQRGR